MAEKKAAKTAANMIPERMLDSLILYLISEKNFLAREMVKGCSNLHAKLGSNRCLNSLDVINSINRKAFIYNEINEVFVTYCLSDRQRMFKS